MAVEHKNLKWGIYTSPQTGDIEIERYIIENQFDLDHFRKMFPQIKSFNMYENLKKAVEEGYIIILTDPHHLTGMPTYCFESKEYSTHPTSMHRKSLGK